jgi:hypothetical protein
MLGDHPELPSNPGSYLNHVKGQLKADVVFGNLGDADRHFRLA